MHFECHNESNSIAAQKKRLRSSLKQSLLLHVCSQNSHGMATVRTSNNSKKMHQEYLECTSNVLSLCNVAYLKSNTDFAIVTRIFFQNISRYHIKCRQVVFRRIRDALGTFLQNLKCSLPCIYFKNEIRMLRMMFESYKNIVCCQSAVRIRFQCRSIFFHLECNSKVLGMSNTFRSVMRMYQNIWNAHGMRSEFLESISIIKECATNFHSNDILAPVLLIGLCFFQYATSAFG